MRGWGTLGAVAIAIAGFRGSAHAGEVVSESESEPFPGIRLVERIESGPNNRIYAAYVSLCTDAVHMIATAPATTFRTPGAWGGDEGVQLAVNGDFFTSGPLVYGDAVGGGVPWPLAQTGNSQASQWYYARYGWIAFGDGWVEFSHTERTKLQDAETFGISMGWRPGEVTAAIPSGTRALVSGFPELVIEGQTYTCSSPTAADCFPDRSDMRDRHPRTAMGLTEDRQTFILVAVDGRDSPTSLGMYGSELATLMDELGAWQAFNLDGGGSTAMWLSGQGYVNQPSDGSARSVANHWGVFAGDAGGKPIEPGSCFTPGGCFPTVLSGTESEPFADLPSGEYAHAEAGALLEAGIVSGCSDEPRPMFCPRCDLTRAHAATMIVRAAGLPVEPIPADATFDDVPVDASTFAVIEAAVAAGWMTGCDADNFCPGDALARADLASIVRLAAGWDAADPALPTYDDLAPTDPAFPDVEALVEHCVDAPCESGGFCPEAAVRRDEAALIVARAFAFVPDYPCAPDPGGGSTGDGGGGETGGGTGNVPLPAGTTGGNADDGAATGDDWGLPDTFGSNEDARGCACSTRPRDGLAWFPLGLMMLLPAYRRGRRSEDA